MSRGGPSLGRIARLARLSRLATGLAWDFAGSAGRLATGGPRDAVAEQFHRRAAELLRDVLGQLKGLPMKLGQLLSYVDDLLPPEHGAIYRETLRGLQVLARPMPWSTVEAQIRADLGAAPEVLFARIDQTPLAAASIGQVHRAALRDGTEVVVKVQYPGMKDAMTSDLENLELLKRVLSLVLPKLDVEQSLSDLTSRLAEECDYGCELCNQEEFARNWRGDAEVLVPQVYPELSGERVLVSEHVAGLSWADALARATPDERSRLGRILFRFVFRSLYVHGLFNADPHPGNYIFLADGRVAFLDYGCVQRYDAETIRAFVALRRLVMEEVTGPRLREALTAAYALPALDEDEWAFAEDYIRCSFAPVIARGPFRYDRAFGQRLGELSRRGAFLSVGKALRKGVTEARRPGFLFLGRLMYGFTSLLVALDAEGDWREEIAKIDAELEAALAT
jgi:predicted unusual protein kinase regulating ubiquinone biosynthesis (AarF/ABC1/UbiB family)